jgi:hypothetical protein
VADAALPLTTQRGDALESAVDLRADPSDNREVPAAKTDHRTASAVLDREPLPDEADERGEPKGPPFWEDWRGQLPDEEIEFVRAIFEEFCSSWE